MEGRLMVAMDDSSSDPPTAILATDTKEHYWLVWSADGFSPPALRDLKTRITFTPATRGQAAAK
jgi:hypothetical protein